MRRRRTLRARRSGAFFGAAVVTALVMAMVAVGGVGVDVGRGRSKAGVLTATQKRDGTACPWVTSTASPGVRAAMLVKAMTPLQEATMLHLLQQGTGGVPYEGFTPPIPSLCIPMITEQDGPAGVGAKFSGATQLPDPIVDGAAWDPQLASAYGAVVGSEDGAKGVDMALGPTINLDRSPLWGRSYETLGEDPYLTASLGIPLVEGIQSQGVIAVLKHFEVYGQELHRGTLEDDSIVSDQALHEVYLPAWAAVVQKAKPGGVMCAYNLINGVPACQSTELLNTILGGRWSFDGFVRSDCGSVYAQAPAIAVGLSQVKCSTLYQPAQLAKAVASGQMARSTLDALALPLLTVLFRFDLIARPKPLTPGAVVTTSAHQAVGLQTDDEGAVLLKNDGILPLDLARTPSIALIGADGATPTPAGLGAMHVGATGAVNALDAFQAVYHGALRYSSGADLVQAAQMARQSTVAIVVVADHEAEMHDKASMQLGGNQDKLVKAVEAANPHTIVVLETGAAVLTPWLSTTAALLETWYPGQMAGTSLVQLLSGAVDPSGKLPVTFPASATQMPADTVATFGGVGGKTDYAEGIDVGYRWYDANGIQPEFPFGYGLTYTNFSFGHLSVRAPSTAKGNVSVQATVTNIGKRVGADVVQCYVGMPRSTGEPPRQLRGFARVTLAPGKSQSVTFELTPGDMAQWSSGPTSWHVTAGSYSVYVGDGSDLANLPLSSTLTRPAAELGADSGLAPGPSPALGRVS